MAVRKLLYERETERRRRKLRWVLENNAGGRRRHRHRFQAGGYLVKIGLLLFTVGGTLGIVYEFFG